MAGPIQIRESQVEDVLASFPNIAQHVLGLDEAPQLIARQMGIASGRLDLLYATGQRLTVVELKVEDARLEFITQVEHYAADLKELQSQDKLVAAADGSQLRTELTIWFPPDAALLGNERDRITWETETFIVETVKDVKGRNAKLIHRRVRCRRA